MGKVVDLNGEQQGPEVVTPAGATVEGGLDEQAQGVVWLSLVAVNPVEGEPPTVTHRIGLYAEAAFELGKLMAQTSATVELQAAEYKRKHGRRLENGPKIAVSKPTLLLPAKK